MAKLGELDVEKEEEKDAVGAFEELVGAGKEKVEETEEDEEGEKEKDEVGVEEAVAGEGELNEKEGEEEKEKEGEMEFSLSGAAPNSDGEGVRSRSVVLAIKLLSS